MPHIFYESKVHGLNNQNSFFVTLFAKCHRKIQTIHPITLQLKKLNLQNTMVCELYNAVH